MQNRGSRVMVGCCELRLSRARVLCRAQTILGMPGNGLGAVAVWESVAELPELREDLRRAEWQSCPLVDRTQLGNEVLDLVAPSQDCSLLALVLAPESKELLDAMFADVVPCSLGCKRGGRAEVRLSPNTLKQGTTPQAVRPQG
jgi:hypothetical protein